MSLALPLSCDTFSGKEVDKFAFHTFLIRFKDVIESKTSLSGSAKLTYLRSYLTEYAVRVIQHLPINDSNYQPALQLLCDEFLDKSYLNDERLKQIINASPKFDSSLQETRVCLNEIRCLLHELQNFNLVFFPEDSLGCVLTSHIVFLNCLHR